MLTDDLIIYLKTTDTCQLNCAHCYTYGSNAAKGFFDPQKTINFLKNMKEARPQVSSGSITFHGGEPFLCPTNLMFDVWNETKDLWPSVWWSIQSNLTLELTQGRKDVLDRICQKTWGTSWDYGIRWADKRSEDLWRDNIKSMASDGHNITSIVSVSKKLIEQVEPIEVIEQMAELGIKHINFERITNNGNAQSSLNNNLIPGNRELDRWFAKMWDQSVEHKTYQYIDNLFFDSILTSKVYQTFSGCRCRKCEQKVFTLNANGTIGGCPNSAVENSFANIEDPIEKILFSEGRMCNIQTESIRPDPCYTCEVYDLCNGDCHQLGWDGDICAAPKSMMKSVMACNDMKLFKSFLNGFQGQE